MNPMSTLILSHIAVDYFARKPYFKEVIMKLCYVLLSFILLNSFAYPAIGQETEVPIKSKVYQPEVYQHYFKGEGLLYKMKYQQAEEAFRKAIAQDSTFGLAYYGLAWSLGWAKGLEEQSREPLQKALALLNHFPKKEKILFLALKASIDYSQSGLEEAITILKEMEKIYPEDKRMLYFIGDCSYHLSEQYSIEQFEVAEQYLRRALEIDPELSLALEHLGSVLRSQGKFAGAEQVLTKGLESYPDNETIFLTGLGWNFFQQKKIQEAEAVFRKGFESNLDDVIMSLNGLGWSLVNQKKYAEAEKFFLMGYELNSEQVAIVK